MVKQYAYRVWNILFEESGFLVVFSLYALVCANMFPDLYGRIHSFVLADHTFMGHLHVDEHGHESRTLTLHYFVNDFLMAFFFAFMGKEVWEAIALKDGSLRGKQALTPVFATFGGMAGPVAVYLGCALLLGKSTFQAVAGGWAIPTATDIAFSYLVARFVFGKGHPAIGFLLLLAIVDDALGLIILAIFYPTGSLELEWLLLSIGASVVAFVLFNWLPRRLDRGDQQRSWSTWVRLNLGLWPYAIAGGLSWYGFQESGLHPALGLLPVIPAIPHADRDFGIFSHMEEDMHDLLNEAEHGLKHFVAITLGLFGLMNAGVTFSSFGTTTWLVLAGLCIGKPIGIFVCGWIAAYPLRLGMPEGMRTNDLALVGVIAGIGFTVALFVSSVAFPAGALQESAKMGALMSLSMGLVAFPVAKMMKVNKVV